MLSYPGDWEIVTVKDVADINTGRRNTQDNKPHGKYKFFVRSPIVERIDVADYDCEAVLTAGDGVGTGKVVHYVNGKFSAHQRVYIMNNFRNISGRFFYYYFSRYFIDEVKKYTAKSSVDSVRRPMIANMLIPLPPLKEQTAIANTLAAFDTHITNLTELITKKKAIRDGALDELMTGRTRLEGFCGDWRDAKIGDILKILHGKDKRNVESPTGHYPILGTGGIIGKATKPLCDWECVLIGRKGTIDRPYYMDKPFWCIDTLFYSKPEENQCVKYQYYLFCSINWYNYMESSGRPSLTRKAIENINIKLPPLDEQIAIADTISALDKEISSLETERAKISQIRDGAMNELLTGKVRLIDTAGL